MHIHIHMYIYIHTEILSAEHCIYVCIHTCIYIYICIHTYTHTYIYIYVDLYIHVYVCVTLNVRVVIHMYAFSVCVDINTYNHKHMLHERLAQGSGFLRLLRELNELGKGHSDETTHLLGPLHDGPGGEVHGFLLVGLLQGSNQLGWRKSSVGRDICEQEEKVGHTGKGRCPRSLLPRELLLDVLEQDLDISRSPPLKPLLNEVEQDDD